MTPTTGLLLGVASALSDGAGQAPGTTLSVISSLAYYTALRQFGLQSYGTVFTRNNRLLFQADWRYLNTSQPTYGLGGIQPTANQSNMNFDLIRFQQVLMKRIAPHLYAGGGYDYDAYVRIDDRGDTAGHVTPFLAYNNGQPVTQTVATGPEVAALHDTPAAILINSMSWLVPIGEDRRVSHGTWQLIGLGDDGRRSADVLASREVVAWDPGAAQL